MGKGSGPPNIWKRWEYALRRFNLRRGGIGRRIAIDASIFMVMAGKKFARAVVIEGDYGEALAEITKLVCDLRRAGLEPHLVFDGAPLPGKADAQQARRQKSTAAKKRVADALEKNEEPADADVRDAATLDADFTVAVINTLRSAAAAATYTVAPYEADAQLVAMGRSRHVDFVLSRDADIVLGLTDSCEWGVIRNINWATMDGELYTRQSLATNNATPGTWPVAEMISKWGLVANTMLAAVGGSDYGSMAGWAMEGAVGCIGGKLVKKSAGDHGLVDRVPQIVAMMKKMKATPENAADHISRTVNIYGQQVVYDCATGKERALGSEYGAHEPCCGTACADDAVVEVNGVDTPLATAKALGFYVGSAVPRVDLVPLASAVDEATGMPEHLEPYMVVGAVVDPLRVSAAAIAKGNAKSSDRLITLAELRLFARTRGWTNLEESNWGQMALRVQKQLDLEEDICSGAGAEVDTRRWVRDPTGMSVAAHWIKYGRAKLQDFPQYDSATYSVPAKDDAGWLSGVPALMGTVPSVSEELIRSHFAPRLDTSVGGGEARVLERGYNRCEGLTSIDIQYHPGSGGVSIVRMRVPASYATTQYLVTLWLRVCDDADAPPVKPVVEVVRALCEPTDDGETWCRASAASHAGGAGAVFASDQCTHVSTVLHVLQNMPRPDGCDVAEHRTSMLCSWTEPGRGTSHNKDMELRKLRVLKPDRMRTGERRGVACTIESERVLCNPFNPQLQHLNKHDTTASKRLWSKHMQCLARDFETFSAGEPGEQGGGQLPRSTPTPAVQAAVTRFKGHRALLGPRPAVAMDRVSVTHPTAGKVEVPPQRLSGLLSGGGDFGAAAARAKVAQRRRGKTPCGCSKCHRDCKGAANGVVLHPAGSADRQKALRLLGLAPTNLAGGDTDFDVLVAKKDFRVHTSHFPPGSVVAHWRHDGTFNYWLLEPGAMPSVAAGAEHAALPATLNVPAAFVGLDADVAADLLEAVAATEQQARVLQAAHERQLQVAEDLAFAAGASQLPITQDTLAGPLRQRCRNYTGFYSPESFASFCDLLDGGVGLFSTIDPMGAGSTEGVTAEMITTRHAINAGDWVAPVITSSGHSTRSAAAHLPLHSIPADEVVQVRAVEVGEGGREMLTVVHGGAEVRVAAAAFVPAEQPAGGGAEGGGAAAPRARGHNPRAVHWQAAVLFVLFVLRTGCDIADCHLLFGMQYSTACRVYYVYLQALRLRLEVLFPYPTEEQLRNSTPTSIRNAFPGRNIEKIIDCHEQFMEDPSDLVCRRSVWSAYKHHCTAKFLASCAPSGACIETSEPRGGNCDDRTITIASGCVARTYKGWTTLADKGFMMHAEFIDVMHELLTPPKAANLSKTFNTNECTDTHIIAGSRIHVERLFRRGQEWKVMKRTLKITNIDLAGSMFSVVMRMTNFEAPLIRDGATELKSVAELTWGTRT